MKKTALILMGLALMTASLVSLSSCSSGSDDPAFPPGSATYSYMVSISHQSLSGQVDEVTSAFYNGYLKKLNDMMGSFSIPYSDVKNIDEACTQADGLAASKLAALQSEWADLKKEFDETVRTRDIGGSDISIEGSYMQQRTAPAVKGLYIDDFGFKYQGLGRETHDLVTVKLNASSYELKYAPFDDEVSFTVEDVIVCKADGTYLDSSLFPGVSAKTSKVGNHLYVGFSIKDNQTIKALNSASSGECYLLARGVATIPERSLKVGVQLPIKFVNP